MRFVAFRVFSTVSWFTGTHYQELHHQPIVRVFDNVQLADDVVHCYRKLRLQRYGIPKDQAHTRNHKTICKICENVVRVHLLVDCSCSTKTTKRSIVRFLTILIEIANILPTFHIVFK
jgi:hypothetical protein